MLSLYHGSTMLVSVPEIRKSPHTLDFGTGFYTTTSFEQARKWAVNKTRKEGTGHAIVSVFNIPDDFLDSTDFHILDFKKADEQWLDFVIANRTIPNFSFDYDIVKGAVANDRVYASINAFESGFMDKPTLLLELKTWVYVDQVLFHTDRALELLQFDREVRV